MQVQPQQEPRGRDVHQHPAASTQMLVSKYYSPLSRKEQLVPGLEKEETQEKPEHLVLPKSSQNMRPGNTSNGHRSQCEEISRGQISNNLNIRTTDSMTHQVRKNL